MAYHTMCDNGSSGTKANAGLINLKCIDYNGMANVDTPSNLKVRVNFRLLKCN